MFKHTKNTFQVHVRLMFIHENDLVIMTNYLSKSPLFVDFIIKSTSNGPKYSIIEFIKF